MNELSGIAFDGIKQPPYMPPKHLRISSNPALRRAE